MDDVVGIEADRGEDDADQDRQQDQPERHRDRCAAEKAGDRPSWLAGNSLVSLGIDALLRDQARIVIVQRRANGEPVRAPSMARQRRRRPSIAGLGFEHPFERFQPIGFARRFVPTQAVNTRKRIATPDL